MKVEREPDSKLGFIRTLIPDEKALSLRLKKYDPEQPIAVWLQQLWRDTLEIQDQQREQLHDTATLATQTYDQNLQALRAAEEKAKSSQSSEENPEPLVALRKNSNYQALKHAVDKSAAKLSQSRMGDDVLAVAWAWPRLMPAKIREEIKDIKSGVPATPWTHPHVEAYEKQIAELKEEKEQLLSEHNLDNDIAPAQEEIEAKISLLKEQIKFTKKFPNPLYQALRPVIENELKTEEKIIEQEDKLCGDIEAMLEILRQQDSEKLREMFRERNAYGETILIFAIQSKCYRVLQVLLHAAPADVVLATDSQGQTLLDMVYGQRLVSDDLSARARSQAGLIKDLQSRGLLDQMQWHREPSQGNYPIHIAVQKAVHTQQIDPLKVLLANDPRPGHVNGPWISQLQLIDGEGDTPLHVAIKVHALAGTGLPIIKCLLETHHSKTPLQRFKNPLYAVNRAGQTVFDLAAALRQSNPLWGEKVWEELQRAAAHYRQQLLNWGFHQKEEKYSLESMFTQRYQAARLRNSEEAELYDQLYAQYKEFYAPILNNDAKKAEALLEVIEHPDVKQLETIQRFVNDFDNQWEELTRCQKQARCLRDSLTLVPGKTSWRSAPKLSAEEMKELRSIFGIDLLQELRQRCRENPAAEAEAERLEKRLSELKPTQQRDREKADFFREILSRAGEVSFYRTIFAALGPMTQHWPSSGVDTQPAPAKIISKDEDKDFLQASQQQALQYAKRLAADETQPAVSTLQQVTRRIWLRGKTGRNYQLL